MRSITIGRDQVSPWSVERITAAVKPRFARLRTLRIQLNSITRSPFGSTTIWLPIVWLNWPGSKTGLASYDSPPSSERANQATDLNVTVFSAARELARSVGDTMRCHVTYTKFESCGSAVSVSLSLKTVALLSNFTTTGSSQFAPPSIERDVSTAFATLVSLMPSATWWAVPLGENDTHGSVARSKSPPLAALPPVQRLNFACPVFGAVLTGGMAQVSPPSVEKPLMFPREPPFE